MKRKWWYDNPLYKNSKLLSIKEGLFRTYSFFVFFPSIVYLLNSFLNDDKLSPINLAIVVSFIGFYFLRLYYIKKKIWKKYYEEPGKLKW